jgi:predicted acyltransferase
MGGLSLTCSERLITRFGARPTLLPGLVLILAGLLLGYWLLMTLVPVPGEGEIGALLLGEPTRTLAAHVDRAVLAGHIYNGTKLWDPEGILSTIPAIGTAMLGFLAGRWISSPRSLADRIGGLFAAGSIGMVLGLMWNWTFPINKQLWTSSYVLFSAGMACVAVATCMWVIDQHGLKGWTKPFVVYGVNPMIAFVGSGLMARTIYTLVKVPTADGKFISLESWIFETAYASWIPDARTASLLFALSFVLLWLGILAVFYRKRIILKV